MYLADGSRRHRRRFEFVKEILRGVTQFILNDFTYSLRRIRWRLGLKLLQFVCQLRPDKIRSGAQDLSEFDERRAKFSQRESNSRLRRQFANSLAVGSDHAILKPSVW